MSPRSGNVRAESREEIQVIPQFEEGDLVSLTPAAIRRREFANMTPRLLYEIGHPNEFLVLGVFDHEKEGPCATLYPCCTWKKKDDSVMPGFLDRNTGKPRCTGHPAVLFEKKSFKRIPRKGDKSSSIHIPFLPIALAEIAWEEDENNPSLKGRVAGQEIAFTGVLGKMIKNVLEENNLL